MAFDPLTAAFDLGKIAIEKLWPDPNKRAEEILKLETLRQQGLVTELNAEVQVLLAQLDINKEEAKNSSIFVAGWRPFIGWIGGFALGYQFLLYPLLTWLMALLNNASNIPPPLDTGLLMTLVTGILGIGGLRSFDKLKGIQTNKI